MIINENRTTQNNEANDTFQCPAGQRLQYQETITRKIKTGYVNAIRLYECANCSSCFDKHQCTKAKGNRQLHHHPTLEQYKTQAKANLTSEIGRKLRKRRGF
jgi:GTP cyclohydrolase I